MLQEELKIRGPVESPPNRCRSCDVDLVERHSCHAQTYSPWIGREGRHAGACWGGRFPTVDEIRDSEKKKRKRLEQRPETPPPSPPAEPEQTFLDI